MVIEMTDWCLCLYLSGTAEQFSPEVLLLQITQAKEPRVSVAVTYEYYKLVKLVSESLEFDISENKNGIIDFYFRS